MMQPIYEQHETLCAILYHLYNLQNMKSTHGVVLLYVKVPAEVCNFTKSGTPPWVFFTFFKLHNGKMKKTKNVGNGDEQEKSLSLCRQKLPDNLVIFCSEFK